MIRPRISAYPSSVTPEYSDELTKILNKLSKPHDLKKAHNIVSKLIKETQKEKRYIRK